MPTRLPLHAAALLLALPLALAPAVGADPVRQVAADDRGITLELALSSYRVGPAGEDGRSRLTAPGLTAHASPGRPVLPSATTLLALPPDSHPVLGAIEGDGEESREGVRLVLGDRRGFVEDPEGLGPVPNAEPADPIRDGPWPVAPVELGVPFTLRGQRMVAVTLQPFRYDEAAARLSARKRLRVTIQFAGAPAGDARVGPRGLQEGAAAPLSRDDPHWDPVFKGALINYEQGRRWRTPPPTARRRPSAGSGSLFDRGTGREAGPAGRSGTTLFDESEAEVRIQIDTTGVYALPYDQLRAKGYPAGVPVGEVSVHRHEFVEDATPAYETIELPIEVDQAGPDNNIFDSGDRIVVFVQNWAERSGATLPQRMWGDAEVIYATRVPRPARRIDTRIGWLNVAGLTPLASYPWTQRWEQNSAYLAFPGIAPAESLYDQFHWTSQVPYYSRPEFQFETNHLDQTQPIGFTIAWQGRRNGVSYYTWGQVRNGDLVYTPVADSVFWSGRANYLASATLPGNALSEGQTNAMVQWARAAGAPPNPSTNSFATASLNWFEATYWRSYRAILGLLSCNSGDAAGPFEVVATGFSDGSALRAYDITDPGDPRLLTGVRIEPAGGEFALRFQDDASAGRRRYLVFSQPHTVPDTRITVVTRGPLLADQRGNYLLIVPEAWKDAVQPLATHRRTQGLEPLVSPLEAVFDEFNGGRRSAWAIKRYLRFALNNWGATFVLLAGDGSEDPQRFTQNPGPDVIPIQKIPGPVQVPPDGREVVPSDGWYVWCLNGCPPDPNPPHRLPPILPELFIGRIPATTFQELAEVVAKLIAYDAFAAGQTWRNRQLLLSDDQYSSATTFGGGGGSIAYCLRFYEDRFRLLNDQVRSVIVDEAGLRRSEVEHFDLGWWLRNEPNDGGSPPCRPNPITTQNNTRAVATGELFTRLNQGRMWWNYQGHANEFVLAHENIYRNIGGDDDKSKLVNEDMPFLFSAFSCHANAFARVSERRAGVGPPMGEELVMMPGRGAIASYASVGYEIIPDNGTDHINVAWARAMFLDPPHDDVLGNGDRGARAVLGETIALAYLRYIPSPRVRDDVTENGLALTYTLLGDPATPISIGAPQAIVTANGDTVVSDRPLALAPPRDTLHLEADLVSNVEIDSIAVIEGGSVGSRTLPDTDYTLTPAFPDTAAGGSGGRRYHLSYVTPIRPGVVRYTIRTLDRYGLRNDFNVVFPFGTQLRVSDNPLGENDAVTPTADLSLKLTVPTPITDPPAQISLDVDSLQQTFTATALDTTRREWILRWPHDPYPAGSHLVELTALDSLYRAHRFRVVDRLSGDDRMLRDVMAFPNPFDDQIGSAFSYYLLADGPADVLLRVFTVTGRLVYQRVERGLPPGYHQWPWNGLDADGDRLANGVYLYKMLATTGTRSDSFDGRLVKLRRPRRGDEATP